MRPCNVCYSVASTLSTLRRFHASTRWLQPPVRPLGGRLCIGAGYDFGPGFGILAVETHLGAGAYGHVFALRRVKDDQEFAVKVVDLGKQQRADVEREVALQQRCAGPHVIAVHRVVFKESHAYVLMEHGDRVSLEERLERLLRSGRDVSVEEALTWFRAMVAAVAECHAQGVVHGDIKPDNFVIAREGADARGRLKLTDFGFAMETRAARSQRPSGTVTHAAPEVLSAEEAGFAADMWSLGTSLYRMIMGIEPYYDETSERITERVLHNQPQFTQQDLADKLRLNGVGHTTCAAVCELVSMLLQPTPYHRWDMKRVRTTLEMHAASRRLR